MGKTAILSNIDKRRPRPNFQAQNPFLASALSAAFPIWWVPSRWGNSQHRVSDSQREDTLLLNTCTIISPLKRVGGFWVRTIVDTNTHDTGAEYMCDRL